MSLGWIVVLTATGLAGCGSGSPLFVSSGRCLPEPLSIHPATVLAGDSVTVSSPPFTCDASYPAGKQYSVSLLVRGGAGPVELGSFPVDPDGSFRPVVTSPASTPRRG